MSVESFRTLRPSPAQRRGRLLVTVLPTYRYAQMVGLGLRDGCKAAPDWRLRPVQRIEGLLNGLRSGGYRPDAVAGMFPPQTIDSLLDAGVTTIINLTGNPEPHPATLTVRTDEQALGRLVVEYYLARGYRSFAYVHMSEVALHCRRGDAFERALMAADQPPPGRINWKRRASTRSGRQDAFDHQARAFFDQLPMPIATLCAGDDLADELLSFCADAAIKVPDELAVMGVDDDDLLCESMDIPLSSVRSAGYQIGRIAVQHLAEGEGTVQAGRIIEVPPPGIAERQSTQAFAVADPALRRALRFMRDHAAESIGIDEVLQVAGLSHTTFAKRFKAAIGRMPAEELRRLRLEHACQLLSETDLSLMDIAQRSGFSSPAYFSATFRREMNQTPTDYRATHATR